MNEVVFIETNKSNWEQLARIVDGRKEVSVAEFVGLYTQAADDLAYARTHYPSSKIVRYLNAIVLNAHRILYKNRYGNWEKMIRYWKVEIPLAVSRQTANIKLALVIFFISVLIGWFSSSVDPSFVRLIMGDSYVNMTLNNIEEGDPMAVYASMKDSTMFLRIGMNNIYVAFLAFMLGIFTSIGTAIVLLTNGIMVGAFFYFFYERGIAALAWSTIMIHGTLELSAIILAGAAGFVLGNSLLFPGTYSRVRSLIRGASEGLKMMIGLIPVFIAAAFLEGYMTRQYLAVTMLTRVLIIVGSLAFILWYFYIYPKKIHVTRRKNSTETVPGVWRNHK